MLETKRGYYSIEFKQIKSATLQKFMLIYLKKLLANNLKMALESQKMEKIKKKIGLYILNFNGIEWLKICLPNVVRFCSICEIFIIDNNSKDGSMEFIKKNFQKLS